MLGKFNAKENDAISPRWMTVEQIRIQQRMRRQTVVQAMLSGALPYEQRGRIRYARVSDVEAWEQARLAGQCQPTKLRVHRALGDFV